MKTFAFILFIYHIQVSFGNKAYPSDDLMSLEKLMSIFNNHAVIISDASHAGFASGMSKLLVRQKQMMFSYHQVHTALVPVMENLMKHASLEKMRDQLQFLVVCEVTCVEHLFNEIDYLDRVVGQGSLLRHFSSWMIISTSDPPPINTTVDNVVWIGVNKLIPTLIVTNVEYLEDSQSQVRQISTLLWMPGGRQWSAVSQFGLAPKSLHEHIFPNKERGLNGRTIVLSTLQWTNYAIREVVDGAIRYKGVGFDIVDNLKKKFNFSYITVEPEDNLWGQELEDGTFTGVLGVLQRKEADLCPVPYDLVMRRHVMSDFSSPIDTSEYTLMYKKTPDVAVSWLFLVSSFSWPVYLCGAGSLLWITLVVFALQYSTRKKCYTKAENIRLFLYIFLHIPFRQDIQVIPKPISTRLMIFTWSVFCLMFAAAYTSNLVAITAVDINKPPFNTMEELAYQTDYKIVIMEGIHVTTTLKKSDDSALQTIYKKLFVLSTSTNLSFDETEYNLLQKVLSGEYVAIVTVKMMKEMMSKSCEVEGIQRKYFSRSSGLAYPKYSPLNKYFDNQLLYLLESGLIDTFLKKWSPKLRNCDADNQLSSVTVNHLTSCLIMVLGGIILAGIVLLFESKFGRNDT